MKLRTFLQSIAALSAFTCGTMPGAAEPGSPLRAYRSETGMKRIDNREVDVDTQLPITGALAKPGAKITYVLYRWHYANPPKNLSVQLCQLGGRCIDASKSPERMTQDFAGATPAQPFYFRARVPGTGDFKPLLGHRTATLLVNWYD